MDKEWLAVKLYTQTQALSGYVHVPADKRLLDILNNGFFAQPEKNSRFLMLRCVSISHPNGKMEKLPDVYINKSTIQMVATLDGDVARGLGAEDGPKCYPFVNKSKVQVRLSMPQYMVIGNIHQANRETVWDLLEGEPLFLPLTDVKIRLFENDHWWSAVFIAVNRTQILSLQEEDVTRDSSPSTLTS